MTKKKSSGAKTSAKPFVNPDDAPELTQDFFNRAEIRAGDKIVRRGRPPLANPKQAVKLRLDADVLHRYRAMGSGWQTRINLDLRKVLKLQTNSILKATKTSSRRTSENARKKASK